MVIRAAPGSPLASWSSPRPMAWIIHSPVRFEANRVKNFYPTDWHREHQIVYLKKDLRRQSNFNARLQV